MLIWLLGRFRICHFLQYDENVPGCEEYYPMPVEIDLSVQPCRSFGDIVPFVNMMCRAALGTKCLGLQRRMSIFRLISAQRLVHNQEIVVPLAHHLGNDFVVRCGDFDEKKQLWSACSFRGFFERTVVKDDQLSVNGTHRATVRASLRTTDDVAL